MGKRRSGGNFVQQVGALPGATGIMAKKAQKINELMEQAHAELLVTEFTAEDENSVVKVTALGTRMLQAIDVLKDVSQEELVTAVISAVNNCEQQIVDKVEANKQALGMSKYTF